MCIAIAWYIYIEHSHNLYMLSILCFVVVRCNYQNNQARAEVETLKDTDVDASTLPKKATTELTKSTTDSVDNIESGKSDEIKESDTEVKSETAAAPATNESSTTSTKVEVVDKKQEASNKKEDSEEYKAMKSIVDTYKSSKSSGSGNSKSKVAVG